jgi:2,3-bisphosphoglycerate-dependent phosphoglycerate mutase
VSHDRRYAGVTVPDTESLKDTIARALPYYELEIVPALQRNERVLVSAHGNSIRGIIKHLSQIGDQEIVGVEIPTGQPLVYELNDDMSVSDSYYLSERAA